MRNRTFYILLFVLSLGCDYPTTFPELLGCEIESTEGIHLFTGEDGTTPLFDGQTIPLTYGFQGGYHVYAGVELDEEPVGSVKLSMNMCQGDTVVARGRGEVDVSASQAGYGTDVQLVYVLHDYQASQLHGIDGVLTVLAEDESGKRWAKRVSVLPKCCD